MAAGDMPTPGDNDGAWGFSTKDAGRIARVVKRVEAQYFNRPAQRARGPVAPGTGLVPASTGGQAVAAGSAGAPARFTATLYVPGGGGPGMAAGATVTAYNPYSSSIAANKFIWLAIWNGDYYVITADC